MAAAKNLKFDYKTHRDQWIDGWAYRDYMTIGGVFAFIRRQPANASIMIRGYGLTNPDTQPGTTTTTDWRNITRSFRRDIYLSPQGRNYITVSADDTFVPGTVEGYRVYVSR